MSEKTNPKATLPRDREPGVPGEGTGSASLLPRISVGRPVTVLMILAALVLLGAVAVYRLPVQMMPAGFDPAFMMIRVPYPGANPTEVEEEIVLPLEDALGTVRGTKEINCGASNDGARCWIEFHNFVDMDETYNEVADRVDRLRASDWPDDIERVFIRRFNPNNQPNMHLAVGLPPTMEDPYWVLNNRVLAGLERVPGVAQVDLEGVEEKQIFIEPDREALLSHNLSLRELVDSLRRSNFALASGDVREAGRKLLVRSVARYDSIEEIRDLPIRADGLRLRDVGRVRYAPPEAERASRLDGQPAAIVEIFKESEANTVEVTTAVRQAAEELFASDPLLAGASYSVLSDQGETIRGSIEQLRDAGLLGGVFAVVVLYFFLRRIRVTLLVTLAIPASLMACLIVLFVIGESLNLVTMMGLIICVGMLVDNGVVVVENIDRKRREGMAVREAALSGASEVSLALTMATITTVSVFLPAALIGGEGMMRFFLVKMALPIVFSILASLIVALLFVPFAAAYLLRSESERAGKKEGLITRAVNGLYRLLMDPLHRFYLLTLRFALSARGLVLLIVGLTLAATFYPMTNVQTDFRGGRGHGDARTVQFFFRLPNSYGMEEADAWFRQIETIFESQRESFDIRHIQTRFWKNRGMVRAMLAGAEESDVSLSEAIAGLRPLIPEVPGVQTYVNWQRSGGSDASIDVTLYGEDTPTLVDLAEEAERRLRQLPDLVSVEPELENALEELRVRVDREQALRYGISMAEVSGTISSALRGQRLPRYREDDKEIEMIVQFPEADREGVGKLAALTLGGRGGGAPVPLDAVADLSISRGYGDISRRDRRTAIGIKLNTTRDNIGALRGQVSAVMDQLALPRGYSWDFGSARRWEQANMQNFMLALLLSVVLIYLVMGFLFESTLLPLSVMPSIFLSAIGVFWSLWIFDAKLDTMASIGLILLAGVVVNNGIVLVDLINRLRRAGMERLEAILEAGRLRFRPIVMTALTTIFGMLPMAFGDAAFVGMSYEGLGKAFLGGLLSSTVLTLVVVPVFYTLLDDLAERLSLLARGRGRAPQDTSSAESRAIA